MLSDIPNMAFAFGYTNSSWTLKVDLVCEHLCRLLAYMDQHGYSTVVPVVRQPDDREAPDAGLPGRLHHSRDREFPQQGTSGPWTVEMNFKADHARLLQGRSTPRCGSAPANRWPPSRISPGREPGNLVEVDGRRAPGPGRRRPGQPAGAADPRHRPQPGGLGPQYRAAGRGPPGDRPRRAGFSSPNAHANRSACRSSPAVSPTPGRPRRIPAGAGCGQLARRAIGQQLLAQDPDRVASLALINSAGFGSEVTLLLRMLAMPVIGPLSTRKTTQASAALLERTITRTARWPPDSVSITPWPSAGNRTAAR